MNGGMNPAETQAFTQLQSARARPSERKIYAENGHSLEFYTGGKKYKLLLINRNRLYIYMCKFM